MKFTTTLDWFSWQIRCSFGNSSFLLEVQGSGTAIGQPEIETRQLFHEAPIRQPNRIQVCCRCLTSPTNGFSQQTFFGQGGAWERTRRARFQAEPLFLHSFLHFFPISHPLSLHKKDSNVAILEPKCESTQTWLKKIGLRILNDSSKLQKMRMSKWKDPLTIQQLWTWSSPNEPQKLWESYRNSEMNISESVLLSLKLKILIPSEGCVFERSPGFSFTILNIVQEFIDNNNISPIRFSCAHFKQSFNLLMYKAFQKLLAVWPIDSDCITKEYMNEHSSLNDQN